MGYTRSFSPSSSSNGAPQVPEQNVSAKYVCNHNGSLSIAFATCLGTPIVTSHCARDPDLSCVLAWENPDQPQESFGPFRPEGPRRHLVGHSLGHPRFRGHSQKGVPDTLGVETSFPLTSAKISDVARMWFGCGSDVIEKAWQKLRERGVPDTKTGHCGRFLDTPVGHSLEHPRFQGHSWALPGHFGSEGTDRLLPPFTGVATGPGQKLKKALRGALSGLAGKSHPWTNTSAGGNFQRTFRTIGPYEFPQEKVWTNDWSI